MSINWAKLYSSGRCRELGISWTEEEAMEVLVNKTATAEEVRARYYPKQIEVLQEKIKEVKIEDEEMKELRKEAKILGITAGPVISKETLKKRIEEFKNNNS